MEFPPRPKRICRVCYAKADSSHFGAESCRACAAFFKRTVLLNRKYICRQSTDKCEVNTEIRFTCRRCRFVKCLEIGMNKDSVPQTPNILISDSVWREPQRIKSESEKISEPGSSSEPSLLKVIAEQYKLMESTVRKNDERVMIEALGDRVQRQNGLIMSTVSLQNKCTLASLQTMTDFATSCFPEIKEFDPQERWLLTKNWLTSRFIFDGVYRAQIYFPGKPNYVMMTILTFADIDNADYYITDLDAIYDKEHSIRMMREATKRNAEWLGPLLKKATIDEAETMAIYGLLCWPSYLSNSSLRVREACYKNHLLIFQELQLHYKNIGRTDFFARVSYVTSILLCVQAAIQRLKEDMVVYRLLDVFSGNELVYSVVNGDELVSNVVH